MNKKQKAISALYRRYIRNARNIGYTPSQSHRKNKRLYSWMSLESVLKIKEGFKENNPSKVFGTYKKEVNEVTRKKLNKLKRLGSNKRDSNHTKQI